MAIVGKVAASTRAFVPAPLESLGECELDLDLYLRSSPDASPSLYRASGVMFDEEDRRRLMEQGIEYLYVPVSQHAALQQMMSTRVADVLNDSDLTAAAQREIIAGICGRLVEDAMTSATGEALDSLTNVGSTISRIASGQNADIFVHLLDMSGHDFYTATHMMNVAIGCGLLARVMFSEDASKVESMVSAGLVHDLGKAAIPAALLNKEGKLTDAEFACLKAHPMEGVRLLRQTGRDKDVLVEVTRDHHEHLAGTGYPRGLAAEQIGLPARIAAVVDVYDALTSARPYRGPIRWDEALDMMDESRESQFDPDVLDAWRDIVTKAAQEHAGELPEPTCQPMNIDDTLPHDQAQRRAVSEAKEAMGIKPRFLGADKRREERVDCRLRGTIAFNGAKEATEIAILDVSRSGVRISCHDRLSKHAVGRLRATISTGRTIDRTVRIVRCNGVPNRSGLWEHGGVFVA